MVNKATLKIDIEDPQQYYLEDETIRCIATLTLEKVLHNPTLYINFMGRSHSYGNGTKYRSDDIFTTKKEISIANYNKSQYLRRDITFEFFVEVPKIKNIPSFRNLVGSEGGKIEYMIEGILGTSSFIRNSIKASHIIPVPLIAKVNINTNELERKRDASIQWPKYEKDINTCVLSAHIPHEGWIRGSDIPISIEFKQSDRYSPVEFVLVELVCQEIIASDKDRLPDMTKQLDEKNIAKKQKNVQLFPKYGGSLGFIENILLPIPSEITPTIVNSKVMKLDYKLRITVKIPEKDLGKIKELSVNLPLVIGTTGFTEDQNIAPSHGYNFSSPGGFVMPQPQQYIPPRTILNLPYMGLDTQSVNNTIYKPGMLMAMPGTESRSISPGLNQVYPPLQTPYPPNETYPPTEMPLQISRANSPFHYPLKPDEVIDDIDFALEELCSSPINNEYNDIPTDSGIGNVNKPNVYTPTTSITKLETVSPDSKPVVDIHYTAPHQIYNSQLYDEPCSDSPLQSDSKKETK